MEELIYEGVGQKRNKYIPFAEYIKGKSVSTSKIRRKLIGEGLKKHICECCFNTTWCGKPIALEVHHKDGDRTNNALENLQLLCPNCHAMTDNWRGRGKMMQSRNEEISDEDFVSALKCSDNIRQALRKLNISSQGGNYVRAKTLCKEYNIIFPNSCNYCVDCGKEIKKLSVRCRECESKLRKVEAIDDMPVSREQLKHLIRTSTFLQIGKNFNVSDNTIRKWCRRLELPCRSHDIKKYTDQEWDNV